MLESVAGQQMKRAIQDLYADDLSHCFGCGRNNPQGHQLKSFSENDEVVAQFTPGPDQISMPGFVYGGLLASLADCHAMATAAVDAEQAAGRRIGDEAAPRFVTAALKVEYLKPTPLGTELEIRGHVIERSAKKAVVVVTISASGTITVRAEVVAVRIPKSMQQS
jgi:acyl-coenzyme A thioesterase PaaI-like protein